MTRVKSPLKHEEDGHLLLTENAHAEAHKDDATTVEAKEDESILDKSLKASKEKVEELKEEESNFGSQEKPFKGVPSTKDATEGNFYQNKNGLYRFENGKYVRTGDPVNKKLKK